MPVSTGRIRPPICLVRWVAVILTWALLVIGAGAIIAHQLGLV